jgi:hypothetical protein
VLDARRFEDPGQGTLFVEANEAKNRAAVNGQEQQVAAPVKRARRTRAESNA